MSNSLAVQNKEFTSAELQLIRDTIAPNATPKEFDLFIYRCKHMGLDPLKPGQIFFIKYGSGPGTIVVGREGFRVRAAKTGKHSGTKLGTIREGTKLIGAWCEVYRSDWAHPARVEVSLSEYNTQKSQWAKMPETMIQKVAEAAALRMAFPDELGGIYIREEMDQAETEKPKEAPVAAPITSKPVPRDVTPAQKPKDWKEYVLQFGVTNADGEGVSPGAHVITFGTRYAGKTIAQAVLAGQTDFEHWLNILVKNYQTAGYDRLKSEHAIVLEKAWLYLRPDEDLDAALDREVDAMVDREKRIAAGNYLTAQEEREWRQGQ